MNWQDIVLGAGSILFVLALLPSVFSKDKPASATSAMTGTTLLVFTATYASLELWIAAGLTFLTALLWLTLLVQQLRRRHR